VAIAPSTDFAAELKQYIAGSSYYMANHPLVDGVYRGTIPAHQLRGWAIQDSHYRRAVPRLAMVRYLRCTDPEIQLQLAEVLAEESEGGYYGSSGHYELFLDFCEAPACCSGSAGGPGAGAATRSTTAGRCRAPPPTSTGPS